MVRYGPHSEVAFRSAAELLDTVRVSWAGSPVAVFAGVARNETLLLVHQTREPEAVLWRLA